MKKGVSSNTFNLIATCALPIAVFRAFAIVGVAALCAAKAIDPFYGSDVVSAFLYCCEFLPESFDGE